MERFEEYRRFAAKLDEDGYPTEVINKMVDTLVVFDTKLRERSARITKLEAKLVDHEKYKAMVKKLQLRDDNVRPLLLTIKDYLANQPQTAAGENLRLQIRNLLTGS